MAAGQPDAQSVAPPPPPSTSAPPSSAQEVASTSPSSTSSGAQEGGAATRGLSKELLSKLASEKPEDIVAAAREAHQVLTNLLAQFGESGDSTATDSSSKPHPARQKPTRKVVKRGELLEVMTGYMAKAKTSTEIDDLLKKCTDKFGYDPIALRAAATAVSRLGRADLAVQYMQRLQPEDVERGMLFIVLGKASAQRDMASAEWIFERLTGMLDSRGHTVRTYCMMGLACSVSDPAKTAKFLRLILDMDPEAGRADAESTAVLVLRTVRVSNVELAQEAWTWLSKAQHDKPHRSTLTEYLVTLAKLNALSLETVRASSPTIELKDLPLRSATTVLQLLLSMKRPDDVVDFARTLRAEGFPLDVFHYGCVVAALAATGKLNAAEVLVKALESSKDPFVAISSFYPEDSPSDAQTDSSATQASTATATVLPDAAMYTALSIAARKSDNLEVAQRAVDVLERKFPKETDRIKKARVTIKTLKKRRKKNSHGSSNNNAATEGGDGMDFGSWA